MGSVCLGNLREKLQISQIFQMVSRCGHYHVFQECTQKSENEHQRRQVLIASTNINANETLVTPTQCILKSGKFLNVLYEIHFMNLNNLRLKIICERIKIQQEF